MKIGIGFTGAPFSVKEMVSHVKYAERRRFDSAWVAEDYFLRDAVTGLAGLAAATHRIKIGAGVINPFTRNPAVVAQTLATLDELADGRMLLALGTGVQPLIEQMGISFSRPLTMIRESVHVIRRLLAGGTLTFQGETVSMREVKLGVNPYFRLFTPFQPKRKRIPIYVAAIGPKMLELAGEIGDGVLLTAGCSPEYVKHAVSIVKKGLRTSGRTLDTIDVAAYVLTSVHRRKLPPLTVLRGFLAFAIGYSSPEILALNNLDAQEGRKIRRILESKGMAAAAQLVSDRLLQTFATAGSAKECEARFEAYRKAGTTLPIMLPIETNVKQAIDVFCAK